jgi:hypothetical protein
MVEYEAKVQNKINQNLLSSQVTLSNITTVKNRKIADLTVINQCSNIVFGSHKNLLNFRHSTTLKNTYSLKTLSLYFEFSHFFCNLTITTSGAAPLMKINL